MEMFFPEHFGLFSHWFLHYLQCLLTVSQFHVSPMVHVQRFKIVEFCLLGDTIVTLQATFPYVIRIPNKNTAPTNKFVPESISTSQMCFRVNFSFKGHSVTWSAQVKLLWWVLYEGFEWTSLQTSGTQLFQKGWNSCFKSRKWFAHIESDSFSSHPFVQDSSFVSILYW